MFSHSYSGPSELCWAPLLGSGEISWEKVMSTFAPHTVIEPLGENSACAVWSAELSGQGNGQRGFRAVSSAVWNVKCDYEGQHCCIVHIPLLWASKQGKHIVLLSNYKKNSLKDFLASN